MPATGVLLGLFFAPEFAQAANRTWGNTGTNFNSGTSWSAGTAPGSSDVAVFSSAAITQPNLSGSLTIQELNFSVAAASGYDLTSSNTGVKLTLTNIGTGATSAINAANTSGTNTIDAPIILGAAAGSTQTFTQASGGTLVMNGIISSTNSVTLSLTGGIITLAGANTYSGGTTLASGTTLRINNATALGTGTFTINGGIIDNTTGASITLSNNNVQAWNGDFTFTGTRSLNLGTGAVTLNATRTVTVSANTLTVGGVISGTGFGLTKAGNGTLTLTGANTYTGATSINAGILNIQNASALGTTAAGTTVASGATLQLQGGITTLSEALTISGTGASGQNGALVNVGGTNNYAGLLTLGAAATISSDAGTLNLTNAGTITGATFGLTLTGSGSGSVSSIIGTTSGTLTKSGTGTWTLTGANTYTGATTINAGTLSVSSLANGGSNSNLGASTNAATNLILNGGTLSYTGAAVSTDRLFSVGTSGGTIDASGSGAVNFTNTGSMGFNSQTGTRTLTLTGTNTGNNTLAGIVGDNTGATSVVKNGTGTWVLTGANTYTGATAVNAGTLFVNGSLASGSAVTVSNSGTVLGGTGTINGSVSIASSGAMLEAGTGSTGQTLTMKGAVTMNSGSIIELALGASGTHSTLAISSPGSLTFATNQDFTFIGSPTIGTYTGLITGVPNPGAALNSWVIDNIGYAGTFSWDSTNGGEIDLNITQVPEPSTWIIGALALAALIYHQRRRLVPIS